MANSPWGGVSHLWVAVCVAAAVVVTAGPSEADLPEAWSYRGLLASSDGRLVPDDVYDLSLSIYDQASGGNQLFSQTVRTPVQAGVYEVHLSGRPDQRLHAALSGGARFLEVTLLAGGDLSTQVLAPRQRIASVPYALVATEGESVAGVEAPLPVGAIVFWDQAAGCEGVEHTCPCGFEVATEFNGRMVRGASAGELPGTDDGVPEGSGPSGDRLTEAELPEHDHKLNSNGKHRHELGGSHLAAQIGSYGLKIGLGNDIGVNLKAQSTNNAGVHNHDIQSAGDGGAHYHPLRSVLFCRMLAP